MGLQVALADEADRIQKLPHGRRGGGEAAVGSTAYPGQGEEFGAAPCVVNTAGELLLP